MDYLRRKDAVDLCGRASDRTLSESRTISRRLAPAKNVRAKRYDRIMLKRLSTLGNTRALPIEKAIRRMLNIDDDTWLKLTIEDQKLIVEPVELEGEQPRRPRPRVRVRETRRTQFEIACEAHDAREEIFALDQMGPTTEDAKRLCGLPRIMFLGFGMHGSIPNDVAPSVERVRVCLERMQAGDGWTAAIDAAIAAVPDISWDAWRRQSDDDDDEEVVA